MDGTLTPVRQQIEDSMVKSLCKLSNVADIGIVTGSGFDYLISQCDKLLLTSPGFDRSLIKLFPCNGTKYYRFNATEADWQLVNELDMMSHMGDTSFRVLIKSLINLQGKVATEKKFQDVPLIGHFISYRGSMINWCPMGRDATFSFRRDFEEVDSSLGVREELKLLLDNRLKESGIDNIVSALGGNTSIDIYPDGWDKTYCLNHINTDNVWFVGDRCLPGENDYSLYQKLKPVRRSFRTDSTSTTMKIIDDIYARLCHDSS